MYNGEIYQNSIESLVVSGLCVDRYYCRVLIRRGNLYFTTNHVVIFAYQEVSSVDRLRRPDNGQGYFTESTLREPRICEIRRGREKERG